MNHNNAEPSAVSACLSQIGLAALIAFGTASFVVVTALLPPWVEVKTQRQQTLWFTQHVKDHQQRFAGYDVLFAGAKWERVESPRQRASGDFYDATEYRICWPVLVGEWVVLGLSALTAFVVLSRRLRRERQNAPVEAEPGAAAARPRV
jgi:hypothetical protein